ncbi:hypothetical protein CPHO_07730 [Corynebacterium phocae]|uniref:Uncharacterized protein n=1 Tax=Corynebacterium phocae TaxID=161895 RepID=A0A1L7D3U9_9CORY|nr:hypothetical protein [Corynebacterium phocae]APT92798.1 hypothetical protein CPHO_07730 [Corynebacterium phocae]KAA8723111.1 hypothetical protein F4V58_07230 [Corynebacterium phocae]
MPTPSQYYLFGSKAPVDKDRMVPDTFPTPTIDPVTEIFAGRKSKNPRISMRAWLAPEGDAVTRKTHNPRLGDGIPLRFFSITTEGGMFTFFKNKDKQMFAEDQIKKLDGAELKLTDRRFGINPVFRIKHCHVFVDCFFMEWEPITFHEVTYAHRDRVVYFGNNPRPSAQSLFTVSEIDEHSAVFSAADTRVVPGQTVCFKVSTPKAWVLFNIVAVHKYEDDYPYVEVDWFLMNGEDEAVEAGFKALPEATKESLQAYINRWNLRYDPVMTNKEYSTMMVELDTQIWAVAGDENTSYFRSLSDARTFASKLAGRQLYEGRWMPLGNHLDMP